MATFNKKNWLSVGEEGANDNNSIISKENMNDLENRIFNSSLAVTFGTGTRSENLTGGYCYWVKIGKLVLIQVRSVKPNEKISGEVILFTGVPKERTIQLGIVSDSTNGDVAIIAVRNSTITMNYDVLNPDVSYFGVFWYEASE